MKRVNTIDGKRMIEGRTFGRVWRLRFIPWTWPYAWRDYGLRCAGFGPIGFMLFDGAAPSEKAGGS